MQNASKWMIFALKQAELAFSKGEVPVGAIFVLHPIFPNGQFDFSQGLIVSKSHNKTNIKKSVFIFV